MFKYHRIIVYLIISVIICFITIYYSSSFWILSEIVILMTFMTSYVSSITSNPMAFSNTWLLGLLLIMTPHAITVYKNFEKMNMGPTDDATRNIKPMD